MTYIPDNDVPAKSPSTFTTKETAGLAALSFLGGVALTLAIPWWMLPSKSEFHGYISPPYQSVEHHKVVPPIIAALDEPLPGATIPLSPPGTPVLVIDVESPDIGATNNPPLLKVIEQSRKVAIRAGCWVRLKYEKKVITVNPEWTAEQILDGHLKAEKMIEGFKSNREKARQEAEAKCGTCEAEAKR